MKGYMDENGIACSPCGVCEFQNDNDSTKCYTCVEPNEEGLFKVTLKSEFKNFKRAGEQNG